MATVPTLYILPNGRSLPGTMPRSLTSNFGGACRLCDKPVRKGDSIVYWHDEPRGAKVAHRDCYTAADAARGGAGSGFAPAAPDFVPAAQAIATDDAVRIIAREAAREWLADGSAKIEANVAAALARKAAEMRDEILAGMSRTITVQRPDAPAPVSVGLQHRLFPELLTMVNARDFAGRRLNIFLSGPAGSGKSTAAEAVATALGLPFAFNGAIDTEYKLLGFTDAMGRLVSRPFRAIWEGGGVYLFDEVDGSMPSALLALNAALANGWCDFPDGTIKRHPDCVIIAAGNTWGNGATAKFIGRNKLDGASLDRFVRTEWPIDETLEAALAASGGIPEGWVKRVQRTRAAIYAKGLEITCSPRATFNGGALLAAGLPESRVADVTLYAGLTREQRAAIGG